MKHENTDHGFLWGEHLEVQRTTVLPDGRLIVTLSTINGEGKQLDQLAVTISKGGHRITPLRRGLLGTEGQK